MLIPCCVPLQCYALQLFRNTLIWDCLRGVSGFHAKRAQPKLTNSNRAVRTKHWKVLSFLFLCMPVYRIHLHGSPSPSACTTQPCNHRSRTRAYICTLQMVTATVRIRGGIPCTNQQEILHTHIDMDRDHGQPRYPIFYMWYTAAHVTRITRPLPRLGSQASAIGEIPSKITHYIIAEICLGEEPMENIYWNGNGQLRGVISPLKSGNHLPNYLVSPVR
ncbi:hypothetical protein BDD12DRAFT_86489 [Trichophaea hybrida]|nr:hypothetical protein BDD12DRAFT_86489 [Trichophaea hybrida]